MRVAVLPLAASTSVRCDEGVTDELTAGREDGCVCDTRPSDVASGVN